MIQTMFCNTCAFLAKVSDGIIPHDVVHSVVFPTKIFTEFAQNCFIPKRVAPPHGYALYSLEKHNSFVRIFFQENPVLVFQLHNVYKQRSRCSVCLVGREYFFVMEGKETACAGQFLLVHWGYANGLDVITVDDGWQHFIQRFASSEDKLI